jgi:NAD-dependent deacetylase
MTIKPEIIEKLSRAKSVAVLTGAGISAESGIKTYRDPDGLWAKLNPQELASMKGFMANPKVVLEWYNLRRETVEKALPNPGHIALAEMESIFSEFTLVTQNIDRLHQRAGSKNVVELHGNIVENKCLDCESPYYEDFPTVLTELPRCKKCGGLIRPAVVWFGENLPEEALSQAEKAARKCDVFLCIGTTAEVYPAANIPLYAKDNGAYVIEINPNDTVITRYLDAQIKAPAGVALPELLKQLKIEN